MPKPLTLTPAVQAILARATITATQVILPQQLDRPTYEQVDKILRAAGGKWNRSAKAHVFPRDPREALGLALETGTIMDQKVLLQQYYTPAAVARDLVLAAEIQYGDCVLEPSAGQGALANEAALHTPRRLITCYEIDPLNVALLRAQGFRTQCCDFLTVVPAPIYDVAVLNPPFAGNADLRHILWAMQFLKSGGRLVTLAAGSFRTGTTALHRQVRALLGQAWIEDLPEAAFREARTDARAVRIVYVRH